MNNEIWPNLSLDFVKSVAREFGYTTGVMRGISTPIPHRLGRAAWIDLPIVLSLLDAGRDTMTNQLSSKPEGQAQGLNKRSPDGRKRPYLALRALAKVYTILAPVVLVIMILVALGSFAREAPLAEKLGSSIGFLVSGGIYYLVMKAMSQAIYLLFDIAQNTSPIGEGGQMGQAKTA